MKCFVALLALVALASGKSFYPGFPYGAGFQGMYPGFGHQGLHHQGFNPYTTGFPHTGMINPVHQTPYFQHQGRVFKRSAASESESFYPGFNPFMGASPFGTPYGFPGATPYYNQGMYRPALNPVAMPFHHQQMQVRPYATHPFMYNPFMKVQEEKKKEHTLEKRETDGESFYPGFPYMGMGMGQMTPYGFGSPYAGYQQPALPAVVPRVLPYNFPGYHYQPYNAYNTMYKPAFQQEEEVKDE